MFKIYLLSFIIYNLWKIEEQKGKLQLLVTILINCLWSQINTKLRGFATHPQCGGKSIKS